MEIQLFNSPQFGEIRTSGNSGNPIFCAADLCRALGYTNGRKAIADHCDEGDVTKCDTPTSSGVQSMTYVNESGLYALIFGSKMDSAKQFKKWVTSEVIPSIRKNGGYIQARPEETPEEIMAKAVILANKTIELQKQKLQMLEGQNKFLEEENKILAPKAEYTDKVLQAVGTYTFSECAKELNMRSGRALIEKLRAKRIIYKQGERYLPFADYADKGYFSTRTHHFFRADGRPDSSPLTVVTEKGRMWLHEKFNVALKPVDLTIFSAK